MRTARRFIYVVSFLVFRPLLAVIPFGFYVTLAKAFSSLASPFLYGRRKIALNNLLKIQEFSEEQRNTVLDEGIKNVMLFGFLDFNMDRCSVSLCDRYVKIEGRENLLRALGGGHGALLAFIHSNTFNIALPCVGHINRLYSIVTIESAHTLSITSLHAKIRRYLWEAIPTITHTYLKQEESTSLKIRGLLKENKVVALSADGQHTEKFFSVPFFDKKIQLPIGFLKLSVLMHAPIVPLFSGFDRKKNVFNVWLGAPILEETPESAAGAFSAQLQAHLRKYPSHWAGWWRMRLVQDDEGAGVFQLHSV